MKDVCISAIITCFNPLIGDTFQAPLFGTKKQKKKSTPIPWAPILFQTIKVFMNNTLVLSSLQDNEDIWPRILDLTSHRDQLNYQGGWKEKKAALTVIQNLLLTDEA